MKNGNRHPADEYADVVAQIGDLEARRAALRQWFLEHPLDRTGDEHWIDVEEKPAFKSILKPSKRTLVLKSPDFAKRSE
jgi:hypothetical protein